MEGGTGYLIAGYLLTWVVLAGYAARIVRGSARAEARLAELAATERSGDGAEGAGRRAEQETPNRVG